MTASVNRELVRLYQKTPGGIWYMNLRDPISGKKIRKSSKTTNRAEAEKVFDREQHSLNARSEGATFREVLSLYTNKDTNPRRKQAEMDGTLYGEQHASNVALRAKALLNIIDPKLLDSCMCELKVIHIKRIKEEIVNRWGHSRKSVDHFALIKAFITLSNRV